MSQAPFYNQIVSSQTPSWPQTISCEWNSASLRLKTIRDIWNRCMAVQKTSRTIIPVHEHQSQMKL